MNGMRFVVGALLVGCALAGSHGMAMAHDHACEGTAEDQLTPLLREAAERLHVVWKAPGGWGKKGSVRVQILGVNDFHGRLATGLTVAGRPVGGAAVLAAYVRDEQASFAGTTFIAHAGDHVGASPPDSALLQDEPAIQFLNLLGNGFCKPLHGIHPSCNVVGTLGNHEFDEGRDELLRLIYGGTHDEGPFLSDPYPGAGFPYVSANVVDEKTGRTILPPFTLRYAQGETIAFIGAVLKDTPSVVTPEGVNGLRFLDEADAINAQVKFLRLLGIESFVVLLHQGGRQTAYDGGTHADAGAPDGVIAQIVSRLHPSIDVVVSGHSHSFSNTLLPNAGGKPTLVTQAFSSGTAYGDIELTIDRHSHDVVEKSAAIKTTFGDVGPGLVPADDVAALVKKAQELVAPRVNRVVGESVVSVTRDASPAGETAMGNLIADAQRAAMGTALAFMNPGGIRADLDAGPVTWGELFTIQPFGNDLVRMDLTGAQIFQLLEQQWSDPARPRILQVSGLEFTWDPSRPVGSRIVSAEVPGSGALVAAQTYSVAVNSFLATGGDGFTALKEGMNRGVGPVDLAALVSYVEDSRVIAPKLEGRIKLAAP